MVVKLLEDSQLYKGIFWVRDPEDIDSSDLYFQVPCDSDGEFSSDIVLTSKSGKSFNHERTWSQLPSSLTGGREYNYYPRGRVEIAKGKAVIYCSPHICNDTLKNWVVDRFNLTFHNGINSVRLVADGSSHYHCYLDD